jgi:hypothetical protein
MFFALGGALDFDACFVFVGVDFDFSVVAL